ncbi:hypothetical protein LTR53_001260 [Teratosphaeriaceae sp. CCFEE 6253]|nr:hypothetical protein LTR53_001260 [Teratosphaeriaceae sp. CCFEE 6253]
MKSRPPITTQGRPSTRAAAPTGFRPGESGLIISGADMRGPPTRLQHSSSTQSTIYAAPSGSGDGLGSGMGASGPQRSRYNAAALPGASNYAGPMESGPYPPLDAKGSLRSPDRSSAGKRRNPEPPPPVGPHSTEKPVTRAADMYRLKVPYQVIPRSGAPQTEPSPSEQIQQEPSRQAEAQPQWRAIWPEPVGDVEVPSEVASQYAPWPNEAQAIQMQQRQAWAADARLEQALQEKAEKRRLGAESLQEDEVVWELSKHPNETLEEYQKRRHANAQRRQRRANRSPGTVERDRAAGRLWHERNPLHQKEADQRRRDDDGHRNMINARKRHRYAKQRDQGPPPPPPPPPPPAAI